MKRIFLLTALVFLCSGTASIAQDKFPYLGIITSEKVNVRAGQHTNFEQIDRLPQGTKIIVVDQSYSWLKIKLPITAGSYVSSDFVRELSRGMGKVDGTRLNVRAGPGTKFTILGQLEDGELVRILEEKDGWLKIEPVDTLSGWLLADYTQFVSYDVPPPREVVIPDAPKKSLVKAKPIPEVEPEPEPESVKVFSEVNESPPQLPLKAESELIKLTGVVESLKGDTPAANVRHQIRSDDKATYYLKGYRKIIDGFLNNKVKIEGRELAEINSSVPTILVTHIKLIY